MSPIRRGATLGWYGGGAIFLLLTLVPFVDRSPNRHWRKRPHAVALAALVLVTVATLTILMAFTGARVAASGLVLVASVALAARVLLAIERARRRSAEDQATAHDPSAQ